MMMRLFITLFFLSISVAIPTASAQEIDEATKEVKGLELGARLGYGIPLGDGSEDSPLSDLVSGKIPVVLDAGYRFNSNIYAGAYFQYAYAMLAEDCPNGIDCSSAVLRYGINADYHFMPYARFDPWAGAGIGYESLSFSVEELDASISGWEFINLSGGVDFKVSDNVAVGPFFTLSVSQYSEAELGGDDVTLSGEIEDKTLHEWLILGIRGRFNL